MATILIVDDEKTYRQYLAARLEREGHEVHAVPDADAGIELGRSLRPQVLIADSLLRNEDSGLRVADALRADDPALQTIVITGFSSQSLGVRLEQARVFRCVEKPFGLDDLVGCVRDALEERAGAD